MTAFYVAVMCARSSRILDYALSIDSVRASHASGDCQ